MIKLKISKGEAIMKTIKSRIIRKAVTLYLCAGFLLSCAACSPVAGPDSSTASAPSDDTSPAGTLPSTPVPEKLLDYTKYNVEAYTAPITEGTVVYNESAMIVLNADGSFPSISLLYPIDHVISVRSAQLDMEYEEGKDYVVEDGRLRILPGTTMPYMTYQEMYPASPIQNQTYSTSSGYVFSVEGRTFHDNQIAITYTHTDTYKGFTPEYKGSLLPGTTEKLRNKEAFTVTFVGDSITYGLNSSGIINVSPFMPAWPNVTVEALNTIYGQNITIHNLGICGTTASWCETQMSGYVLPTRPDLLVIAFGMNDGCAGIGPDAFVQSLSNLISAARRSIPDCEILLISTMLPNPEIPEVNKTQKQYEQAMLELEEEGIAVVQFTSFHESLLQYKNYRDMSGDNLVHTNDFLARMYAQAVLAALIEKPIAAEPAGNENQGNNAIVSRQIPERPETDPSIPTLQVLVNEKQWIQVPLTDYLGQSNTWIEVPLDPDLLRQGKNQFALDSNAYNRGNLTYQSLDIYSTGSIPGIADSFISTNDMVYWNVMHGRILNIKLELFDGENWIEQEPLSYSTSGGSVVIGKFTPDGNTYLSGRTIGVASLGNVQKVRLMVNAHVGISLLDDPAKEKPDTGSSDNPVLKVQLNQGAWSYYELSQVSGQSSVWVTVPLDAADLRSGANSITVDSNVINTSNLGNTSVDLYFTATQDLLDTYLSTDSMNNWVNYTDRYANIYLEAHNKTTGQWEAIGKDTFAMNESTVIGEFSTDSYNGPFNMRRILAISDCSMFDEIRAVIQIHVGDSLRIR